MGNQQFVSLTGSHGEREHGNSKPTEVQGHASITMRELAYMIQIMDNTNIFVAFVLSKDALYITLSRNVILRES